MRPNFEEPLDTAKQMVDRNITLYFGPGQQMWKQFLLASSVIEYNILAENMIIADDWDHFDNISKYDVIKEGTHARLGAFLGPIELEMGSWYRSQEKVPGLNSYAGYLTNKKWHLNEVIIQIPCP